MEHNKTIVIVGATGMLGSMLQQCLVGYTVVGLTHADIDITQLDTVRRVLSSYQPDIIINAAAFTAVDDCETKFDLAMAVNGTGPSYLAQVAKELDAWLIHYSTDYVFAGDQSTGYSEDYPTIQPVNAYGQSKAAGEVAIQQLGDDRWKKYYIIRTAWLYGPGGKNFVDTMLALAKTHPTLTVVNDQHGSPTYTKDLAKATRYLIEHNLPAGVYHVTNAGSCTWYEFATTIFKLTNTSVTVQPCTSAEFPRPATRPHYSILLNTKLPPARPWADALADYLLQS
ncbi:MAG: dTDP-4-dehydrorhamnose reductase [Candidatus Kerfeldbacteria bacterium]|nr:dTDP-4-dehydrorhamnose reductase [Candidatus Kerfeldbacteria bacterium]